MSVTDYSRSTARRLIGEAISAVSVGGVLAGNGATAGAVPVAQSSNSFLWLDVLSFGSNANDVAGVGSGGSSASNSRADHVHRGVGSIVANGSNALYGAVGLTAGRGIALTTQGGTITLAIDPATSSAYELLVADGLTSPPDPLYAEDGTDFLYGLVE